MARKHNKTSRCRIAKLRELELYEARKQPNDLTIADIAGAEIIELQHEQALFTDQTTSYINEQAKMLPNYNHQTLGETKLKAFKMAETAKNYGLTNLINRLNGFCDTITKYEYSHD